MRAHGLYILVCVLGFTAITLRTGSLRSAHRCATTAARAATLTGTDQRQARDDGRSAARVSATMSLVSLAAVLAGGMLWFVGRQRQRAEPVLPALLLLVYVLSCLVTI